MFIVYRGKPRHIYFDNGAMFVKANGDLKELAKSLINYNFKYENFFDMEK